MCSTEAQCGYAPFFLAEQLNSCSIKLLFNKYRERTFGLNIFPQKEKER